MKFRVEYTVEINSKAELGVLLAYAKELGLNYGTEKKSVVTNHDLLKRLFQKKGEDVRQQNE